MLFFILIYIHCLCATAKLLQLKKIMRQIMFALLQKFQQNRKRFNKMH